MSQNGDLFFVTGKWGSYKTHQIIVLQARSLEMDSVEKSEVGKWCWDGTIGASLNSVLRMSMT